MKIQEGDDIKFMRRCLDLAGKAEGMTYPNPLVGSVIVHDGIIIGEGYHLKAGGPHAEVNAINSVRNKNLLESSSLYVNLEPCSHTGKTPPCADLIISSGIRKVIIGTIDTSENVAGEGIAKLTDAGCDVITGVLEKECRRINRRFFTFNEKNRPYIILKWAQSADGFLDADRGPDHKQKPARITGNTERALVHKWRASEQSILVGAGTLKADNPQLNVRYWAGNDPLRLILSGSGVLDSNAAVFNDNGTNIVFTYNADAEISDTTFVKLNRSRSAALQISDYLYSNDIQSVLIEGGARVLGHFISAGLWDEARIFFGKDYFKSGIKAPELAGVIISQTIFSKSLLKILINEAD
jgi:diaminohydroxyphosphoribosylaminopyrimidine deaminase/5-amino-6-(5-phosphoribosylamino)uracil reductase